MADLPYSVAEIIAALSLYPPNTPVVLEDADTNWFFMDIVMEMEGGVLVIKSEEDYGGADNQYINQDAGKC